MSINPLSAVSIVLSAYNAGLFIRETLESILSQTHRNFELLVYDDGSRDNTWDIIQQFSTRDARIRATKQENIGQSATLNQGIAEANYPLVMIFDADDIMMPNCVAMQVAFLEMHPQLVGAGCLARFINAQGKEFWNEKNPFVTVESFEKTRLNGETLFFRHPGFIFRREIFNRLPGGYRNIAQSNDIDMFNRLADLGPILTNPQVLMKYRVHANQDSLAYKNRLEPRLTWAWIGACAAARCKNEKEPTLQEFKNNFYAGPWLERWRFTLSALGVAYWYEARVEWITGQKSFLYKAPLSILLSPAKTAKNIWRRLFKA